VQRRRDHPFAERPAQLVVEVDEVFLLEQRPVRVPWAGSKESIISTTVSTWSRRGISERSASFNSMPGSVSARPLGSSASDHGNPVALAGRVPGVDRELVERMVAAVEEIGAMTGPEGVRATALASMRTLGETAALISPRLKQRRPEVPWGRLIDLGTLVADTPVADELVEKFATQELPLLDMQLRSVLGSLR
jgi:uncharacterized protein with HEPN domain